MFVKRGDDQKIKLVDPDDLSPEQKELIEEVSEKKKSQERQDKNED